MFGSDVDEVVKHPYRRRESRGGHSAGGYGDVDKRLGVDLEGEHERLGREDKTAAQRGGHGGAAGFRAGFLLFVLDEPAENAARAVPGDDLLAEAVGLEPAAESCQSSPAGRESAGRV